MKNRSLLILLAYFLAPLAVVPFANAAGDDHDHHSDLEEEMSAMNKAWRTIRRQIGDASKNASTLKLVATVKQSAQKSINMVPMLAEEKSGAARENFIAGYKKGMENTVKLLSDLEKALKAKDNAKAAAIVEKINDARSEGHDKYKPEDE